MALPMWPLSILLLLCQLIASTTMRVMKTEGGSGSGSGRGSGSGSHEREEKQPGGSAGSASSGAKKWIDVNRLSQLGNVSDSAAENPLEFAGGHASNIICDVDRC